jgi:nucleotide-binding universal stress UspA family protein
VATVSTAVLTGADVVGVLEAHREEIRAGLTVLASHGRGPVARAWLGSVADRFVRTSSAPVLLVRAADEAPEPDLASDLPLTRVLVPVDGSRRSEAALEPATELAGPDGVEYTLLRVVESPHALGSLWFPHAVELTEEQVESVRDAAQGEADATARTLADRGYAVEPIVEFGAPVAAVVLDVAARRTPDLIAISTHGRGGVRRLLLGSVADKVVRGAECPVLVVRPRD